MLTPNFSQGRFQRSFIYPPTSTVAVMPASFDLDLPLDEHLAAHGQQALVRLAIN